MKLNGVSQTLLLKTIELAKKSKMTQKHGAIMFYQNRVYSSGINNSIRSRMMGKNFPSIHAEMDCISRKSGQDWKCLLPKKTKSKIQYFSCACESFRKFG